MAMTIIELAEQLEQTALGIAIAESRYAFPIIEGLHLIGLSIAVGLLFIADLRLIGVLLKRIPAGEVLRQLRPWILGGFAVILISGVLLLLAEASAVIASPAFAFKMLFLVFAGINAGYFEWITVRRVNLDANLLYLPKGVKYAGIGSIGLWSLVIICGRLIPYLPSWDW